MTLPRNICIECHSKHPRITKIVKWYDVEGGFSFVFLKQSLEKEKYWKENFNEAEKEKVEYRERAVALEAQVNELKQEVRYVIENLLIVKNK